MEHVAYVGIGSNLGNRLAYIRGALHAFHARAGGEVMAVSPVYESPAHTLDPGIHSPDFLNAVIAIQTTLAPEALLEVCMRIEREAGRDRGREEKWSPRTLDCDLLVVGEEVRSTPNLSLPHPRLHERRFVLVPLADLAPNLYIPPPHDATVQELLARCADPNTPRRVSTLLHPSS